MHYKSLKTTCRLLCLFAIAATCSYASGLIQTLQAAGITVEDSKGSKSDTTTAESATTTAESATTTAESATTTAEDCSVGSDSDGETSSYKKFSATQVLQEQKSPTSVATDLFERPAADNCHFQLSRPFSTVPQALNIVKRHTAILRTCDSKTGHSPSSPETPKDKIVRIAIVGGGGAGCITALLLSQISDASSDVEFEITLFERNTNIINGSAFETASILHAGGNEYSECAKTAAECRLTGELFAKMFPSLYSARSEAILFASAEGSGLTPEKQKQVHDAAVRINASKNPGPDVNRNSPIMMAQEELPNTKLLGGIRSIRDKSMKNFERNALIKQCISKAVNIRVITYFTVKNIQKDHDDKFIINNVSGKNVTLFDHVIMTAWDQTSAILGHPSDFTAPRDSFGGGGSSGECGGESGAEGSEFDDELHSPAPRIPALVAEPRVFAVLDTEKLAKKDIKGIVTLTGGSMLLPISADVAMGYSCREGASYPQCVGQTMPQQSPLEHAVKIMEDVKKVREGTDGHENPLAGIKLIGARLATVVREHRTQSSSRRYIPPFVTDNGIIAAIPLKATYIGTTALQIIELLLNQLPEDLPLLKAGWKSKILAVVPSNTHLYSPAELPPEFIIGNGVSLTKVDIRREKILFLEGCKLTAAGNEMLKSLCAEQGLYAEQNQMRRTRARSLSDSALDAAIIEPLPLTVIALRLCDALPGDALGLGELGLGKSGWPLTQTVLRRTSSYPGCIKGAVMPRRTGAPSFKPSPFFGGSAHCDRSLFFGQSQLLGEPSPLLEE